MSRGLRIITSEPLNRKQSRSLPISRLLGTDPHIPSGLPTNRELAHPCQSGPCRSIGFTAGYLARGTIVLGKRGLKGALGTTAFADCLFINLALAPERIGGFALLWLERPLCRSNSARQIRAQSLFPVFHRRDLRSDPTGRALLFLPSSAVVGAR